jgi:DNA-binding transcriptional ArsR family regulator
MTEPQMRHITDPRMLRAMAHPVRIKLINALVLQGPATATELADRVGDTPANCSWHLRQLAKFGFIEEADDLPYKGRNRPWRWVPVGNRWGGPDDSPAFAAASAEVSGTLLGIELSEHSAWEAGKADEPAEWQTAAFTSQNIAWLTAEELEEAANTIREVILRHHERTIDPSKRPNGSRPIRFIAWGNPAL